MPIKFIQPGQAGVSNNTPSWVYIETNDTLATVTAAGYLSGAANEYINSFKQNMMALVSTKASASIGVAPVLYLLQLKNNNGSWSLINPGTVAPQLTTVVMNNAMVNGAFATPVTIIPPQGASSTIMLLNAQIITEVSTPFANGGTSQLQYGNTINAGGTLATSATIATAEIIASSSQVFTQSSLAAATVLATATYKNLGIYFTNATGAFTGGAGSTITVCATYIVIPTV